MLLPLLFFSTLLTQTRAELPLGEPDGSRTLGVVPPFLANPAPPRWLRTVSHAAAGHCRHYLYEAYGNPKLGWLVRYLNFPATGEAPLELERSFLFRSEAQLEGQELSSVEVHFEVSAAIYQGTRYPLVDRRDLFRPR